MFCHYFLTEAQYSKNTSNSNSRGRGLRMWYWRSWRDWLIISQALGVIIKVANSNNINKYMSEVPGIILTFTGQSHPTLHCHSIALFMFVHCIVYFPISAKAHLFTLLLCPLDHCLSRFCLSRVGWKRKVGVMQWTKQHKQCNVMSRVG